MVQRTELQILVQALTALCYEIRAGAEQADADDRRKLRSEAKVLLQSAQVDADLLAFLEQTREAGVQIELAEPIEPIEPKSMRGSGDDDSS